VAVSDPTVTHHVVDRPKLLPSYESLPKSREYVQPQWIVDCANFRFILPVKKYGVGKELPPHLSPWEEAEEGYRPKYADEVERMKNGELLEDEEEVGGDVVTQEGGVEKKSGSSDDDDESKASSEEEDLPSHVLNKEKDSESAEEEEEEEEEDEEETNKKVLKKKQTEDEEAKDLAKALMSKKAARLYGRMQHGIAQKQAKVDNLHKKRREIESSKEKKDGKSFQKLKVERLKKERKDVEGQYADTGGSMKKKRRK
jgi:pescadillo protein